MGHAEKPSNSAVGGPTAGTGAQHHEHLQERLAVFQHHRALLLEALLEPPTAEFVDPFSGDVDHQRLFDALPLTEIKIDCRNDDSFDLPRVINFFFKRRDTFNYFVRLFENRDAPDRLYQALVYDHFKAVNLRYEREEVFLLLRLSTEQVEAFHDRDHELRAALNPLFKDRRVTLGGDLLRRFCQQMSQSERLRTRALAMDWEVDRRAGTLTLSPPGSCEQEEAIASFKLFLFSRPPRKSNDRLQKILVALFRGETLRVPRTLEAEFMAALKDWDLLLRLCRGRSRQRDPQSGDLMMGAPSEPTHNPEAEH